METKLQPEIEFIENHLPGIKTPLLLPEGYSWKSFDGRFVHYTNHSGEEILCEPYMCHDQDAIMVDEFRKNFNKNSVIIMVKSPNGNLFLQRRGMTMRWEPGKIDLVSVSAQGRAKLVGDHFELVDLVEFALKKIAAETGIDPKNIKREKLHKVGEYYNPLVKEYQAIFVYEVDASLDELNENIAKMEDDSAEEWFEQSFQQTMDEYFGDGVEKYAGGAELRPVNFISDKKILQGIEDFIR